MPIKAFSLILGLSLFLEACHNVDSNLSDHGFDDITLETRLNFQHTSGVEGRYLLPEIMGSGGALFDYDNDGLLSKNEVFRETEFAKLVGLDAEGLATGINFENLNKRLRGATDLLPFLK